MIECSCQVFTTTDFNNVTTNHADDLVAAGSIKRAVGVAYNTMRKKKDEEAEREKGSPHQKACTTCLPSLAEHIQDAGFYRGETFPPRPSRAPETISHSCPSTCTAPCRVLAAI